MEKVQSIQEVASMMDLNPASMSSAYDENKITFVLFSS